MRKSLSITYIVFVLLFTVSAFAADRVVVVPLGSAVGNATIEDVVEGKTFSNSTAKGLTGTLELNPAPTGDAVASDVLKGKTFSNNVSSGIEGTMATSTITYLPKTSNEPIAQAYHVNSVVKGDSDLDPSHIKKGINLFNVLGLYFCDKSDWHIYIDARYDECMDDCAATYDPILAVTFWQGCKWGCQLYENRLTTKVDAICTD